MSISGIDPNARIVVPDPLTVIDVADDFVSGLLTSGLIGSLSWVIAGGTFTIPTTVAGHPGVLTRDTSATISTTAYTILRSLSVQGPLMASESFDVTWLFKLNQTDADTRVRLGLSSDWTSDVPANGVYLEKTLVDTQWFGVCRAASAQTRTAALATTDTNWHKVRIRRVDASTMAFSFDGGAEVTLAATVPTAAVTPGMHIFNNVASSKTIDLDYFRLRVTGLVR